MEERLQQLGWCEIEVVDDDLGRSAAGTVTRAGFERMVAEVCLGKVGAVAAREVSRFARNSREWQQLIEVCRVVDTVLIDQETVYTPKSCKTWLALEMAVAVASGSACLDKFVVPAAGLVLLYAAEDSESALRLRVASLAQHHGIPLACLDIRIITADSLRVPRQNSVRL